MTITGSGFGAKRGTSSVLFAGRRALRYVSWSDTKIKVKVPALALGRKAVVVKTAGGRSSPKSFKVT